MEPEGSLPHLRVPDTCPYPEPDQSMSPNLTSWKSNLTLFSHLCLGILSGLFPSGFHTKTLYTPLLSPTRATYTAHLIPLDLINWILFGEQYRSLSFSLCSFFPLPCHLVSLRHKCSPQHPILKHPQLTFLPQCERPSFTPIHNRQNYSSVYLNLKFLDSKLENKRFCTEW